MPADASGFARLASELQTILAQVRMFVVAVSERSSTDVIRDFKAANLGQSCVPVRR
jgi:hypothetical protein